jgi:hypothetical protein
MTFWKPKRRSDDEAIRMAHEQAVNSIYKYERKTLAIAKMRYYHSFNFDHDVTGQQRPQTDDFLMMGVLDEIFASKRINCEVRFIERRPDDVFVGDCTLSHFGDEAQSHHRPLMLSISIWDQQSSWRWKAYDCVRDAAFSQHRFCHFRIATELADIADALRQLQDRGYGPTVRLREFTMWPTIILPNAPTWGWKQDA